MSKRTPHFEIAERIRKIGKCVLVGQYLSLQNQARFFCLEHKEVHNAKVSNVLQGAGLICCKKANQLETARRKKEKAKNEYDEKILAIGKVERIDEYLGIHKSITHRCLIHGEIHSASPAQILNGSGLKCCLLASAAANAKKMREKAARELVEDLKKKNPNIIWESGEYKNDRTNLNFFCLIHEETHPASPSNVKRGQGLKCCHRATVSKNGLMTHAINSISYDTAFRALNDELERKGNAQLYFYESPEKGFNKYGISVKASNRASSGGYGQQLMEPHFFADRRDAVLIEQAFRFGWGIEPPESLKNWAGKNELTQMNAEQFQKILSDLEMQLVNLGRWEFAEKYCDPKEVQLARDKAINS